MKVQFKILNNDINEIQHLHSEIRRVEPQQRLLTYSFAYVPETPKKV